VLLPPIGFCSNNHFSNWRRHLRQLFYSVISICQCSYPVYFKSHGNDYFIRSFVYSFSAIFYLFPHLCRAQLLFIFGIFIHIAFISATISRPGEGNRLLPLKREGRRGAYADRDDDVTVGFLSHFYLVLFTQPVPFLLYLFLLLCSACSFLPQREQLSLSACIFFIYLVSFLPKTSFKKTQPFVSIPLIPVGHNYYFFMFVVISILFFAYFIFALTLQLNYSTF